MGFKKVCLVLFYCAVMICKVQSQAFYKMPIDASITYEVSGGFAPSYTQVCIKSKSLTYTEQKISGKKKYWKCTIQSKDAVALYNEIIKEKVHLIESDDMMVADGISKKIIFSTNKKKTCTVEFGDGNKLAPTDLAKCHSIENAIEELVKKYAKTHNHDI